MDNKQYINKLSRRVSLDYKETSKASQAISAALAELLAGGDSVAIPGFGTFTTVKEDESITTDLSTGRRILLPPSITPHFSASQILTKRVKE